MNNDMPEYVENSNRSIDPELYENQIRIERKRFCLYLKENAGGRYLKITEEVGGRRGAIIVPGTGLRELAAAITEAADVHDADSNDRPPAPPNLFEPSGS